MSESLEIKTLQDRLDRIQELEEFTENCKTQLDKIYETLGWSRDYKRVRWLTVNVNELTLI